MDTGYRECDFSLFSSDPEDKYDNISNRFPPSLAWVIIINPAVGNHT
jgi:hypothetical protein